MRSFPGRTAHSLEGPLVPWNDRLFPAPKRRGDPHGATNPARCLSHGAQDRPHRTAPRVNHVASRLAF